jgi:sialic acid synthase SpsE
MIKRLELPFEAFGLLKKHCERRGILFLSTPFDDESADYLDSIGMPAFKIPSGEITNIPFLSHIAAKGKPVILSTGMSTMTEVAAAVRALRAAGARRLVLLHCVSNYPAAPADVNLRAMAALAKAFRLPVGYSDHTLGVEVSIAAAALGACVIEKHFTLDRRLKGPDHAASLEPGELAALVRGVRTAHAALGDGRKRPAASEREVAAVARRSIVAARAIPAGAVLSAGDLAIKRPGTGLPPAMRDRLLGRRVKRPIPAGAALTLGMLA